MIQTLSCASTDTPMVWPRIQWLGRGLGHIGSTSNRGAMVVAAGGPLGEHVRPDPQPAERSQERSAYVQIAFHAVTPFVDREFWAREPVYSHRHPWSTLDSESSGADDSCGRSTMQSAPALQEHAIRFDEPVRSLLRTKGRNQVWSVTPDETVYRAIEMMSERQIGCLVVLIGGQLAGIVSERDYARKVILKGRSSQETRVREIMTTPALFVTPEKTVADAMRIMTNRRVRHLPVLEGDNVVGMLSIGDLVNWVIDFPAADYQASAQLHSWKLSSLTLGEQKANMGGVASGDKASRHRPHGGGSAVPRTQAARRIFRAGRPLLSRPLRQSASALSLDHQPLSGLRVRLQVLLRALHARVHGAARSGAVRAQDFRQGVRRRAIPRGAARVAARGNRSRSGPRPIPISPRSGATG